jgi:predicted dehydrogenase
MAEETKDRAEGERLNRRRFISKSGAAAASFTILRADLVRGSQANSKVSFGLIGCGGRGIWIAELFRAHGGYQAAAGADYFTERVNAFGDKLQVDPARRYTGLSGYKRLLDSPVDAVVIESPPYFHPAQAAAAVDAGKHVFLAKPIAVDAPGCKSVAESGKQASAKKLCFLVDFQTRTDPLYREAVKRVQYGDIGRIVCGEATYICGPTWETQAAALKSDPKSPENRLKAWGLDRALSGDVITEQNIHSLDVATWILDAEPVRAYGTGGQKARQAGDCWDHFSVVYTFPGDVLVTFCSKQLGQGWDDICCRMYGTDGTIDTHYFGEVSIRGKTPFRGGRVDNLYPNGAIRNIAAFHESIVQGQYANPTVPPSVRSNLTTILGRTAAYRRAEVEWADLLRSEERFDPQLKGLRE